MHAERIRQHATVVARRCQLARRYFTEHGSKSCPFHYSGNSPGPPMACSFPPQVGTSIAHSRALHAWAGRWRSISSFSAVRATVLLASTRTCVSTEDVLPREAGSCLLISKPKHIIPTLAACFPGRFATASPFRNPETKTGGPCKAPTSRRWSHLAKSLGQAVNFEVQLTTTTQQQHNFAFYAASTCMWELCSGGGDLLKVQPGHGIDPRKCGFPRPRYSSMIPDNLLFALESAYALHEGSCVAEALEWECLGSVHSMPTKQPTTQPSEWSRKGRPRGCSRRRRPPLRGQGLRIACPFGRQIHLLPFNNRLARRETASAAVAEQLRHWALPWELTRARHRNDQQKSDAGTFGMEWEHMHACLVLWW